METPIRIFNEQGIEQFRTALQHIKEGGTSELPENLLFDPSLSSVISRSIKVGHAKFTTALEMVEYLHPKIIELPLSDKFYNSGLWTWLAAFYFDVICPFDKRKRLPSEEARYIMPIDRNFREAYRHLIATPLRIYDTYGSELTLLLLYTEPHQRSEFLREIMGVQELAMNQGIMDALHIIYWDVKRQRPKIGAVTKSLSAAGTLRRFVALMNQFNRTYDLQGMTGEQIVALLPEKEFGRWLINADIQQFAFDFDE